MRSWAESAQQFDGLTALDSVLDDTDYWGETPLWRGHGVASWALKPEVYRERHSFDDDQTSYRETSLLFDFMQLGTPRIANPPSEADQLGWLTLAQHFGLPTRLLDWSMNPLVALYFAVANHAHDDEDGCVWALWATMLNEQQGIGAQITSGTFPDVAQLVGEAFGNPNVSEKIVVIQNPQIDLRMLVQQSIFTIHGVGRDLAKIELAQQVLRKYIVPKSAKKMLRRRLDNVGISRSSLFPDLAGLAKWLKFGMYAERS